MKGWHLTTNKELIDSGILEIGDGYRAKNSEFDITGLPFARAGNINNGIQLEDADLLSQKSVVKAKDKVSHLHDCVITTKGTFGRVGFVKSDIKQFVYSPQLCYWRSKNKQKLNPQFLFYWLQGPDFLSQAYKIKSSTDMADYANLTDQRSMNIHLPILSIQQKIAAILSSYDDVIENNNRRITILEKMAEETYREWFVRMRFSGHEKVKIEKGVPKGWEERKLLDVADITYGFSFDGRRFNSEGISKPIIRIRNIPHSSITDFTDEHANEKYIVRKGDLLIGMDGEFHINHWCSDDAYLVQRTCRLKAKNPIHHGYLAKAIYAPVKFYESILQGATVGHLGAKHLNSIGILIPSDEIDLSIFNNLLKQKVKIASSNSLLRQSRDRLLSRLMSGKLDVENLDIRFPKSMEEELA